MYWGILYLSKHICIDVLLCTIDKYSNTFCIKLILEILTKLKHPNSTKSFVLFLTIKYFGHHVDG